MADFFEFLFKYRPVVFEKGHIVFATSGWVRLIVVALGLAACAGIITYMGVRMRGQGRGRIWLSAIRALIVVLVTLALLRPALEIAVAPPKANVVGVLIDDSRSMDIADLRDGETRANVVRRLLGDADSNVLRALEDRFVVRLFRTGGRGAPIETVGDLSFDNPRTRFAPAIEGVRQEISGMAMSGIILVSDGGDNAASGLTDLLQTLKARRLPIYTVGLGQERFAKDIEISRITAPASILKGGLLDIQVDIVQHGFDGQAVQLTVDEEGHVVNTRHVTLPRAGEAATVRIRIPAATAGSRAITVRLEQRPGELVSQNNVRTFRVNVKDRREKILYVDGEPRFEVKFLRNAVQADAQLQLATMVRVTDDRFFRFNIDARYELASGFPATRAELFQYRGIVIGNVEANFFSLEQMRMISEFVSERGGGLMMLGGRHAFAEGGYAGTPIADVLPVDLSDGVYGTPVLQHVTVNITSSGLAVPATQIAESEAGSAARWKTMPAVTSVNRLLRAKPGAATLLTGTETSEGRRMVALASHRYGRGKSIAFAVQDSWLWQMRSDTPIEDVTYATFWRQMLRWLISDARDRVTIAVTDDQIGPNEPLYLTAEVVDSSFTRANVAVVKALVKTPSGAVHTVNMEWSGIKDGEYRAVFSPTESGKHEILAEARLNAETITSEPTVIDVGATTIEYFGAEQRSALLQRIANETGGRYYTQNTVDGLAKDLVYSDAGHTTVQRLDLWDIPLLFFLLVALICGEWWYRRSQGLI